MKQNDAPVEVPFQVEVGTSRYGERSPPCTLPNWSSTGWPFCTTIGEPGGGGTSLRTQESRFFRMASKKIELGNRLRGPSLQFAGGTARPPLMMSAGAAANSSSVGVACPAPAISYPRYRSDGQSLSGRRDAMPIR